MSIKLVFEKNHSTMDNVFILHMLSEYYSFNKKKLFCTFIDFQKAFDSVWRLGLWSKLLKYCINGKFLTVVKNMYACAKSCVSIAGTESDFFQCYQGLRQGQNLSPLLFSLYLNDLEHYLLSNGSFSLDIFNDSLEVYLKLIVLLYADDTVLFATSQEMMNDSLYLFSNYCDTWQLQINYSKTKVIVFGDRVNRPRQIEIKGNRIDVVNEFKYLGVIFHKNRKFASMKKHVVEQAKKALFSLYQKTRNLDLTTECQLKLFDHTILPILTYGSEIWCFGDLTMVEKVHTDFLKRILKVKSSTPNVMLYGDLGRFPISLSIKKRAIGFWYEIVSGENKLSSLLYKVVFHDYTHNIYNYKWLAFVKSIFDQCGLSYVWQNQFFSGSKTLLLNKLDAVLKSQFVQNWHADLYSSNKCLNYRMYKTEHKFEK